MKNSNNNQTSKQKATAIARTSEQNCSLVGEDAVARFVYNHEAKETPRTSYIIQTGIDVVVAQKLRYTFMLQGLSLTGTI